MRNTSKNTEDSIRPNGPLSAWVKRLLRGLLAVVIAIALTGMLYQAIATRVDGQRYPAPGQLVDVGGYRLHLYCIGENRDGRPTVILETGLGGLGANSAAWVWLQQSIAMTTRVCAYDRAGLGWSDPSPLPRDAKHIAAELHTLLQNSHTPGPYVLAGWSYGGLYVRAFAAQYPKETAGLVLLDSSLPDQCKASPLWEAQCASTARSASEARYLARLGVVRIISLFQSPSGLPALSSKELQASFAATKDWDTQDAEFRASSATSTEIPSARGALGTLPLYVVTATDHDAPPDMEQSWQIWQAALTGLSANSVQRVVPGATHASLVFSETVSKISVAAILQVVQAAHTGAPLRP